MLYSRNKQNKKIFYCRRQLKIIEMFLTNKPVELRKAEKVLNNLWILDYCHYILKLIISLNLCCIFAIHFPAAHDEVLKSINIIDTIKKNHYNMPGIELLMMMLITHCQFILLSEI